MADEAGPLEPIVADVIVAANVEDAWRAVSGAETFPRWFAALNYQPRVGAQFHLQPDDSKRARGDVSGAMVCEVEALEPLSRMQFSWGAPGRAKTWVVIGLRPIDPRQTFVRLHHSGWDQFPRHEIQPIRDELWRGYRDFVMPALKALCEGRAA
ncbi:MAG: SRPBCC domain-containing protein [Hyphomonadaceae bacterium]